MRKTLVIGLAFIAALLFIPFEAAACKSCDNPGFWDPNCSHSGCTYCVACSICCGGDPGAGGNCQLYCGGAAPSSTSTIDLSQLFGDSVNLSSEAPVTPAGCSSASR
jgi:hypothetical protein